MRIDFRRLFVSTLLCLCLPPAQLRAQARVSFGAFHDPGSNFIIFTGNNEEDADVQCRFTVRALYENGSGDKIGFREVAYQTVIRAKALQFREEAGKEIIEALRAQFGSSTRLTQVDHATAERKCTDTIELKGSVFDYSGRMKNGVPEGRGTKTFKNGAVLTGMFVGGRRSGDFVERYPDGSRFEGSYVDDERSGRGTLILSNGDKYEGQFSRGKINGFGEYIFKQSSDKYVGNFKDGKFDGSGTYYHGDGRKHVGDYQDNYRNGRGVLYFKDGARLESSFKDGLPEGDGTFFYAPASELETFTGVYSKGMRSGSGAIKYKDGKRFDGTWKDDKAHGYFKEVRADGSIWKGFFENGTQVRGGLTSQSDSKRATSSMGLKLCNAFEKKILSAVATRHQGTWQATGWYSIDVGACISPNFFWDKSSSVYLYAYSGTAVWPGSSNVTFCLDLVDRFEVSDKYCQDKYHPDLQAKAFWNVVWPNTNEQRVVCLGDDEAARRRLGCK